MGGRITKGRRPRPQLRLIRGGLTPHDLSGVAVHVVALDAVVPKLDAVVIEEDTFLVLGADPVVREPMPSLSELERELASFEPPPPGGVLVRGGQPLQLLAIVHDLDRTPSWDEEWVGMALHQVLEVAERRQLKVIAMPMLGTVHGRLPAARFIALLRDALMLHQGEFPHDLWLAVPREQLGAVHRLIDARADQP